MNFLFSRVEQQQQSTIPPEWKANGLQSSEAGQDSKGNAVFRARVGSVESEAVGFLLRVFDMLDLLITASGRAEVSHTSRLPCCYLPADRH